MAARAHPPTLITWGRGDPFFLEPGARAYLRDVPDAELHLFDTGHFALEENLPEIAPLIATFLDRTWRPPAANQPLHWAWADLMRRAFDIDVLACPRCGGRLQLMATVEDPEAIRAILGGEQLDRAPPPLASAHAAGTATSDA